MSRDLFGSRGVDDDPPAEDGPLAAKPEVSLDATFSRLQKAVEDLDELLTGAEAGCRCGNYTKAEERLVLAAKLATKLGGAVGRLQRRVTAAGVITAWR